MCGSAGYQTVAHSVSDWRVSRLICTTPRDLDASIGPQYLCTQSALSKALTIQPWAWRLMMGFSHVRKSLPDGGAPGLACFPVIIHDAPWPGRLSWAPTPLHGIRADLCCVCANWVCSRCGWARFCSRQCQLRHGMQHECAAATVEEDHTVVHKRTRISF